MFVHGEPLFLFGVDAFDPEEGELGIEEEVAEETIGLGFAALARPVDFVVSPPYYLHLIQAYRKARAEPRARDEKDFREMLQMYRAATGAL